MDAGLDKVDAIWEKEVAIIDGMDISGAWNRMFEQRVIWEYTPELIEKIADLPGGESLGWCYGCAKCTAVCPVDIVGDYSPRKILPQDPAGHRPVCLRRPVAVHHLHELPARVSKRSEHDPDHAGGARAGRAEWGAPAGATEGVRGHRQARQPARPTAAQARRLDQAGRRAGADPGRSGPAGGRLVVRRLVSLLPSARHRRRPRGRAHLPRAGCRLRHPGQRGEGRRRLAAAGRRDAACSRCWPSTTSQPSTSTNGTRWW